MKSFDRRSAMNNFLMLTKNFSKITFSPSYVFFFSLHQTTKKFFAFIKTTIHAFVILSHVLYATLIDWLIFKGE